MPGRKELVGPKGLESQGGMLYFANSRDGDEGSGAHGRKAGRDEDGAA